LADKLESWKHMNGLRWDDQIAKLKDKNRWHHLNERTRKIVDKEKAREKWAH
jgi:hypothetical protein